MNTLSLNRTFVLNTIKSNLTHIKEFDVQRLALFGSFTRNEQTNDSDCDILVSFRKNTFRAYIGLRDYLEGLLNTKVDLVCEDSIKEIIKPYILKDAIWLVS